VRTALPAVTCLVNNVCPFSLIHTPGDVTTFCKVDKVVWIQHLIATSKEGDQVALTEASSSREVQEALAAAEAEAAAAAALAAAAESADAEDVMITDTKQEQEQDAQLEADNESMASSQVQSVSSFPSSQMPPLQQQVSYSGRCSFLLGYHYPFNICVLLRIEIKYSCLCGVGVGRRELARRAHATSYTSPEGRESFGQGCAHRPICYRYWYDTPCAEDEDTPPRRSAASGG
jgi:hypothetical protein